jgi:hypothetical protein
MSAAARNALARLGLQSLGERAAALVVGLGLVAVGERAEPLVARSVSPPRAKSPCFRSPGRVSMSNLAFRRS